MPNQVKTLRILMFVATGLTLLMTLAFLVTVGVTPASLGAAVWFALPGAIGLALALRIPNGGTALRWGIVALESFYVLLSFSTIGQGDPRGVTNLILPATILVLLFRRGVKSHFTGKTPAPGIKYGNLLMAVLTWEISRGRGSVRIVRSLTTPRREGCHGEYWNAPFRHSVSPCRYFFGRPFRSRGGWTIRRAVAQFVPARARSRL